MKRLLTALLSVCMSVTAFGFAACGGNEGGKSTDGSIDGGGGSVNSAQIYANEHKLTQSNDKSIGVCDHCRETLYTMNDTSEGGARFTLSENRKYYIADFSFLNGKVILPGYYKARGDEDYLPVLEASFSTDKITEIELSSTVEEVEISCSGIEAITVPEANGEYKSVDGVLFDKSGTKLIKYPASKAGGEYAVPGGVTKIGERAFESNKNLTSVRLPDGVTNIGDYAFNYCKSLTSVTIGNGVTSIGKSAFRDCLRLVEVYNLSALSITKGSSENGYAGYYAKDIYTSSAEPSKLSTDENGYIIYTDGEGKILMGYTGAKTDLTLPEGITEIYQYAFASYSGLTSIVIPESVTSIGSNAFYNCSGLTSVTIGNGVTTIGEGAFQYCSLTSIIIPDSVTGIGNSAFSYCSSLTSIEIPDGVTSIGDYAFYNCSGLTSVTIGNGMTHIGDYAFYYCYKLVEVYNLSALNITKGSSNYGGIGGYAKDIYTSSAEPSKLSTDENGYIIYTDGESKILMGYTGAKNDLTLPEGITKIYQYAFFDCSGLTNIAIPDGVTSIGDWAFYNCSGLTSVTVGNGVTSIGNYAFVFCRNLASIKFGGTTAKWNAIEKGDSWALEIAAAGVVCTDGTAEFFN